MTEHCPNCGHALDEHDRHVRFKLPTPVFDQPDWEKLDGLWMSHETPSESVMLRTTDLGAFVRVLLPVRLDGGYQVTYGAWLGVDPDDMRHAFDVWWSPSYPELRLEGRFANTVEPWGLLGTPVVATVIDDEHTPYCTESSDQTMATVLGTEWAHELILSTLPASHAVD